jgi:hypothetical protein
VRREGDLGIWLDLPCFESVGEVGSGSVKGFERMSAARNESCREKTGKMQVVV